MKTTPTIEESAHLIELGVDASLASKCRIQHEADGEVEYRIVPHDEYCYELASLNPQPIFDLSDILSILPKEIDGYHLNIEASDDGYDVSYILYDRNDGLLFLGATPTAPELIDALNQLLIWCLENGHLKTEKK